MTGTVDQADVAPSQAEVDHLSQVLAEAYSMGIRFGTGSLARHILAAGYRKEAPPGPPPRGVCRACSGVFDLVGEEQVIVEHPGRIVLRGQCLGSRLTPARMAADGD